MPRSDTARRRGTFRRAFLLLGLACITGASMAQFKGNPARGETLAKPCAVCHGTPEREPLPLTPSLARQPEDYTVMQLFLLREGLREAPQMAGALNGFTDFDLLDVAAYFGRQKPSRNSTQPDPKLHARGAGISKSMGCGSCHLQDFRGQKQIPRISNQREDYLAATMKAYRDNKRTGADTSMNGILYKMADGDIEALAHYLANQ